MIARLVRLAAWTARPPPDRRRDRRGAPRPSRTRDRGAPPARRPARRGTPSGPPRSGRADADDRIHPCRPRDLARHVLARPEIRCAAVAALAPLHGHGADRARPRHRLDDGDFLDRVCGAGAAVALCRPGAPGLSGRTPGLRHRVAELRRLAPARHVVRRHRELTGRRGVRHGRPTPAAARLAKRDRRTSLACSARRHFRAVSSTNPMPGPTPPRLPS